MSFWWYKRDKNGKNILWQIEFYPMVFMVIIGLLAALVGPRLFGNLGFIIIFPSLLMFAGLICFDYREGIAIQKRHMAFIWHQNMSVGCAALYRAAYILLTAGVVILVLLLTAIRK